MKPEAAKWIDWGAGELAFLGEREALRECEQALERIFGISRAGLYLGPPPDPRKYSRFSDWVRARKSRIPSSYLFQKASFWDDELDIEEGVFIPRPETETLIEGFLKVSGFSPSDEFRFLDVGTGSGVLAVTLAKLFPRAVGLALDLSEKALGVARRNAERLRVADRLQFILADGLGSFHKEEFDCIVSNPPYVSSVEWETLEPEVQQEPRLALDGGVDGLDFYRRIFRELSCLKAGGSLWLEVGWNQGSPVKSFFEENGFRRTHVFKDLSQVDRVVSGWR